MKASTASWSFDWKAASLWIGGGVGTFVLCLLATFPYDALHARLVSEAAQATNMEVRVAEWAVGLPLGLEWRAVTFSAPQRDPVRIAFIEAKLGLLRALTGGVSLDVAVHMDDAGSHTGVFKGSLMAPSWSFSGPVTVKGHLQQIDLSKVVGRYVTHGLLTGDFLHRLEATPSGPPKGDGTWNVEVQDLTIDHIPVGNGRTLSLTFARVTAGMACHDTVCDVTDLKGDGPDGSVTGQGTITLQRPVAQSQLALTLTLVPGAGFATKAATAGLPPLLPAGTSWAVKVVGTVAQTKVTL